VKVDQEETIQFLKNDHQKLENVLSNLTEKQMKSEKVQGSWTVREILAHISAWNWEMIKQAEFVLAETKPWYTYSTEAEFNEAAIKARESWTFERILSEWQESFHNLISRVRGFSDEEWMFEMDETWPEGGKVSVSSVFGYRYRGEGHEGGHAIVIANYFGLAC
jgi:uncharacterized damage-inducible protein DinB